MSEAAPQQISMEQAFQMARQKQAAGELDEARHIYERILTSVPVHAESLTMLASITYQKGDDTQADAFIGRAIEVYQTILSQQPGSLAARAPLVNLLLARNRISEAQALMADLNLPLNPIRATPEVFVERRKSGIARGLPPMLINTVPKSASESIWNRLAEGLGLAQCHLSLGLFPDCCLVPARVQSAGQGGLIAKEHIPATAFNLKVLADSGVTRVLFHLRDPRQAVLSWAHFVHDDVSLRMMAPIWRKVIPPAAVLRADLATQIDWCIDNYLPLLVDFVRGWDNLCRDDQGSLRVKIQSFELFLSEPEKYFAEALDFYDIDPSLFAADAEAETVHLRKGMTDEWRGVFTRKQSERAWELMPRDMAKHFGWQP